MAEETIPEVEAKIAVDEAELAKLEAAVHAAPEPVIIHTDVGPVVHIPIVPTAPAVPAPPLTPMQLKTQREIAAGRAVAARSK